jgi:hypothetical protein
LFAVLITAAKPKCGGSFTASKNMLLERRYGMIKAYTILMFGILLGLSLASWIELVWK